MIRSLHVLRAALAVLVPTCAVYAQNLLVVDGQNRPGTNFTDLPAAVAAANPGDVLQVRSDGGSYGSFATSKGLTICADVGQAILLTGANGPLTVTNLPAGEQFTLRGFLIGPRNLAGPIIQVANCAGPVVLQSLEVGLGFPSVAIQSCAGVLLQESRVLGGFPAVAAQNSTIECSGGTLQGGAADDRFNQQSTPAGVLRQCRAVFVAQVFGGIGRGAFPPAPALDLTNSSVDAGAVNGFGALRAGGAGVFGSGSASAVTGQNSSLRLDPAMPVVPTGAAPAIVGVTARTAQYPGLFFDSHSVGGAFIATRTVPGAAQVLLIGLPAAPMPVAGVAGNLWLDPRSVFVVFPVPQGMGMPNLPFGTVLAGQIAALSPSAGVELSNVAMFVVR